MTSVSKCENSDMRSANVLPITMIESLFSRAKRTESADAGLAAANPSTLAKTVAAKRGARAELTNLPLAGCGERETRKSVNEKGKVNLPTLAPTARRLWPPIDGRGAGS